MKLRNRILLTVLGTLSLAMAAFALLISYDVACGDAPSRPQTAESMTSVVYRCYGGAEVLEVTEQARPVPAADEVLVRVQAAAVNPLDWHYMRGSPYVMRLMSGLGRPADGRLGTDFSGIVEAVGDAVTDFVPGEAVFGSAAGAFARYLVVREDRAIARKPEGMSFAQAATVGVAGITALQALRDKGQIRPGQRVLINGASGGVGTFAVQIAKAFGAHVTGVCSTRNVDMVRALGADRVIDYKREDYTVGGGRYDLIVDMVGNHSPLANEGVLAADGRLIMVGGPGGDWVGPFRRLIEARLVAPFVEPQLLGLLARLDQADLRTLADMMERGELTPVIDRSFPLTQVPDAIRYSESGRARGKIVVQIGDVDAGGDL